MIARFTDEERIELSAAVENHLHVIDGWDEPEEEKARARRVVAAAEEKVRALTGEERPDAKQLVVALESRAEEHAARIKRLHEIAAARPEAEDEADELLAGLRLVAEMELALRRLVERSSVDAIHHAFGAPGDWGYHTRIGDALARVYGVHVYGVRS